MLTSSSKVDDALDTLEMIAGLFATGEDGEEEEEEDAEADEDDTVDDNETPVAMRRRLRQQKAEAREKEKQKAKDRKVLKRAQHALDSGSLKGVKEMKGAMKEVIVLMEEPLCAAMKEYKQLLCDALVTTLLEVFLCTFVFFIENLHLVCEVRHMHVTVGCSSLDRTNVR